ncbi:hypothetical protein NQZ68_013227 [Dissostichus eleginoides]|nr:hypothetical protein NQZ68_013227 [Dissostichus eleginoides]
MAHCSESILRAITGGTHSSPQPRRERGAIMSEDNIIFLNDLYGFGMLDAGLMAQQTTLFNTVSPQRKCIKEVTLHPTRILSPGGVVSVDIESDACRGRKNEINTVEHVQVRVSISAVCRGDLSISLVSPAGTVSLLLDRRPNDASTAGMKNWTLMTVHCWGEQPQGLWTFQVTDHRGTVLSCSRPSDEASGALLRVTLILYGTYHPHRAVHGITKTSSPSNHTSTCNPCFLGGGGVVRGIAGAAALTEGPLHSVVSMGSRHPVPHRGLQHGDRYQTLELIEWIHQMERGRKIRAADITLPARHKMLKISGDLALDEQTLKKPLKSSKALQLHQTDEAQKSSMGSQPSDVKELHETKTIMENLDRVKRSLPLRTLRGITNTLQIQEEQQDGGGSRQPAAN